MHRLALVAVGVLLLGACTDDSENKRDSDGRPDESPSVAGEAPAAALGTRLVGSGRVVTAVPDKWLGGVNRRTLSVKYPECRRVSGVVVFQREPSNCVRSPVLAILSLDSDAGARLAGYEDSPLGEHLRTVDEIRITRVVCGDSGFCIFDALMVAVAPELGVVLYAQGSRAEVDELAGSVQLLPEGYTTVPFIDQDTGSIEAVAQLEAAGLAGKRPEDADTFPHYFVGTDPAAGAVVQVGETVDVLIGDG